MLRHRNTALLKLFGISSLPKSSLRLIIHLKFYYLAAFGTYNIFFRGKVLLEDFEPRNAFSEKYNSERLRNILRVFNQINFNNMISNIISKVKTLKIGTVTSKRRVYTLQL